MGRWLLTMALAAGTLTAQQDANDRVQKVVHLKYADASAIQRLLSNFGVETIADSKMKVLTLAGQRSRVTTAEDAIKQLDVPGAAQKDIELTVFFLVGSDAPNSPASSPIPQDLQSTVATLKTTFPFKSYSLLDALSLRTRAGSGADTTGQLAGSRLTTFRVGSASLEADGSIVRIDRLHAGLRLPHTVAVGTGPGGVGQSVERRTEYIDTGISTEVVDVKEGQKLVVGRSSLEGPTTALFLVLIAKVVN